VKFRISAISVYGSVPAVNVSTVYNREMAADTRDLPLPWMRRCDKNHLKFSEKLPISGWYGADSAAVGTTRCTWLVKFASLLNCPKQW